MLNLQNEDTNYKNILLLKKFVTIQGKILPRRFKNINAKKYRYIVNSLCL